MPRQKTHEEFLQQVFDLVEDEYTVLESYQRTATKISFKHNLENCGNIFMVRPADFLRGTRCPKCYLQSRGSKNSVITEVSINDTY
jgi:hypothetical protein